MLFGSRLNRLATSIRQGISKYAVGSDNPGLVFDFIDNFYQKDKNQTVNFDGAITHARSSNATMTDGYGPELVTNGTFTNDISGWTTEANSDVSYDDGKIRLTVVNSTNNGAYQELTTESGKTYIFTALLVDVDSHASATARVGTSAGAGNLFSSTFTEGAIEFSFTATSSTSYITLRPNSTTNGNTAVFDNVSVREMPVIKWAPHNLVINSEDFSSGYTHPNVSLTSGVTDPTGGTGAFTVTSNTSSGYIRPSNTLTVKAGVNYTLRVFHKNLSGTASIGAYDASNTAFIGTQSITNTSSDWALTEFTFTTPAGCTAIYVYAANSMSNGASVDAFGLHVYRSDLGGMVDNPDRGDSYVPTTSSARYLPRVGHHVYNGSAWVNEGVLAESEERVNLVTDSSLGGWSTNLAVITTNSAVSPSGQEDAVYARDNVFNGSHYIYEQTSGPNGTWTFSVYIKEADSGMYAQLRPYGLGTGVAYATFDPADGSVYESGGTNLDQTTSEDVGNGWYRVSITCSEPLVSGDGPMVALTDGTAGELPSYVGANEGVYLYGAQVEQASTPSSLIPTSGSSVTRAAETFTIPSANLPWPTPQYIGSELVTNGDYSDGTNDWTESANNNSFTVSSGKLLVESDGSGYGYGYQSFSVESGKTYLVKGDYRMTASGIHGAVIYVGTGIRNSAYLSSGQNTSNTVTNFEGHFTATATGTAYITVTRTSIASGFFAEFDNISVREIDPLSVSIAMDGRMTYADTDVGNEANFFRWYQNNQNLILNSLQTGGSRTGQIQFRQEALDVNDSVNTSNTYFSPDILVPFNMASRHGSTFVNGAESGVALTANTTPVSLADLSSTNLVLAHRYMGTIGTFRVWDKDLGDDGIVEATNPSLEPSLSLTFEGTGTNSFVINDWSE